MEHKRPLEILLDPRISIVCFLSNSCEEDSAYLGRPLDLRYATLICDAMDHRHTRIRTHSRLSFEGRASEFLLTLRIPILGAV